MIQNRARRFAKLVEAEIPIAADGLNNHLDEVASVVPVNLHLVRRAQFLDSHTPDGT